MHYFLFYAILLFWRKNESQISGSGVKMKEIKRFFKDPKHNFFLFGPRGTGKSSWIEREYPEGLLINLLLHENFLNYSRNPDLLIDTVHANPDKKVIIIDEIQKIPELLSVVHILIEEKKGRQFILTGSSTRKLKKAGVDLLGGRAWSRTLHPFMAGELKSEFNLENALKFGLLPLVMDSESPREMLKSYIALYLKEEVQAEGLVRNIGNFNRFLEVMSFSHGSVLNAANISRECHVSRTMVDEYIQILEDLLLGVRLKVFTKRAQRAPSSHPKFYYFDAGVFRSMRTSAPLDRTEEMEGHALEGLIFQHLRAWNAYSGEEHQIYFWRTRSGVEVDFIIYGPTEFCAIEVKNNKQAFPNDVRALKTFKEDYPEAKVFLLYRGKQRVLVNGILCIPCEEFLVNIYPGPTIIDSSLFQ